MLDLSPAGAPAPALQRVVSHARTEFLLTLRNGEQLTLALVIPIGLIILGRYAGVHIGLTLTTLAPSVLALAIWSTAFTSLAIATGFERRYGVLERLAATPLGRGGVLAGKALASIGVAVLQLAILSALALALGWRPHPTLAQTAVVTLAVPLAGLAFAALALVLAGRLRAEVTLAVANLSYLAGLVLGGVITPLHAYPAAVRPLVELTPTAALGESLRLWSAGGTVGWPLLVLTAWALVLAALARTLFRWTS